MTGARTQFRLAWNTLRVVASTPQLLLYPTVLTALALTTPVVVFALIIFFPPIMPIVLVAYLVGMPFLFAFLMVAYCYELNERFDGRRPPLAAGIGVAAARLRLVAIAALAFGPAGFFVYYASALVRFVPGLERVVAVGIEVVSMFAYPAVACADEDDSIGETFESLREAVEREFGTATIAAVGFRFFGATLVLGGFVTAAALVALWWYAGANALVGSVGLAVLPLLALAVLGGSVTTAIFVTFTASGVVKTALYRYATDDELPATLGVGISGLVRGHDQDGTAEPDPAGRLSWLQLGVRQARAGLSSASLWILAVFAAGITGIAAFLASRLYASALETGLEAVEATEVSLDEVATADELEALELVLGTDPTLTDVSATLEALQASGDVLAVTVLSTLILALGPVVGLAVTVPSILRRRSDGSFDRLLEAGYRPHDVVLGAFLGRLAAASIVVVLPALAIALAVWHQQAPVGLSYVAASLFAVACVGIFVAFGVLVGSVARGWKSAVVGSVGVWLVPFALAGNPLGTTSADRETILEAALAAPWDGLPTIVTRLNLYNVIADGMHMVTISSVLEPVPRISRVALGEVVTGDAPPQAAAADLPLTLHQFAVYPIVALWIVVPLLAAVVWFDPNLE
ncbi:ABC transporter permease [Natrarchaeobaculum aegyptiacum]|uniref:ABC transporter permease n=1 Tax=Natrarchaeobaculum aegyptiacum TaxID=745377 RepID=UPI0012600DAF|nr:ABC transporter permease subunit [Natrarchaeobaculum aegyptiacum]